MAASRRRLAIARAIAATALLLAVGVGGCVGYRQESAALRLARPSGEPAELAAYARAESNYPSVGGDILEGTSPTGDALYRATAGGEPPATAP